MNSLKYLHFQLACVSLLVLFQIAHAKRYIDSLGSVNGDFGNYSQGIIGNEVE
jgi:hypothetical protein